MPKVYLDSVSTTPVNPEILKTYEKLSADHYYNSDSLYDDGVTVYRLQEKARENIAELLKVKKDDLIFTSGASEANSLAIKGLALANPDRRHIISSIYEHSSVYNALEQLRRTAGYEITYLYPNAKGVIDPDKVKEALRDDTLLVSIMHVNNEIGAVNDIDTIKKVVKANSRAYFHTDTTQSLGKIAIDLKEVDLASFSAHKIHGLKGSGLLYKRQHIKIEPLISGGQQEYGLRGGTSNAPANIVLAKTIRLALAAQKSNYEHIGKLYDHCLSKLNDLTGITINSPAAGIKTIINFSTSIPSEVLLNALNLKGIMISSRSTCGSRINEPSRVLTSMGIADDRAVRISFDGDNRLEEIDYFIDALKEILQKYGRN